MFYSNEMLEPKSKDVIKNVQLYEPRRSCFNASLSSILRRNIGSSIKEWKDVCKKNNYNIKTSTICCYPTDQNFINAHTKEIIKKLKILKILN